MAKITEQWGRIFIWAQNLASEVHPEDLEIALELSGVTSKSPGLEAKVLGDIAMRVAEVGDYVTVDLSSHAGTVLRVKKGAFKQLPGPPQYFVGDAVSVQSKGATIDAAVCLICWHLKDAEYYYFVQVNGKRLKRRYYGSEISKIV